MAGIGFELKKLFAGRGAIAKIRAYTYAGIISTGSMLMAVVLLLSLLSMARAQGASEHTQDTLVVLLVYAMLFSLVLSSLLQMLLSRYVADQLYAQRLDRVMPSLFGGSLVLMLPGGAAYGVFLSLASEIPVTDRLLSWMLFIILIPVWLQMAYITAAKDYRMILIVFAVGVAVALGVGYFFPMIGFPVVTSLLLATVVGYGVMLVGFTRVLLKYFPLGTGHPLHFLSWLSRTPELVGVGFFSVSGAYIHLLMMWRSALGEVVTGPFLQAPTHDTAAFFAFLVTLPTSINFIVSVEVNFYRKYRAYFNAISGGGALPAITAARKDMIETLRQEMIKVANVQLFSLVAYIIMARYFLQLIGFTTDMISMFSINAIGYSAYAVGNCAMMIQLYFNDRRGALLSSFAFWLTNLVATPVTLLLGRSYYGIGFVAAGMVFYVVALRRLFAYVQEIDYHVFCEQPVLNQEADGFWIRLVRRLERGGRRRATAKGMEREVDA